MMRAWAAISAAAVLMALPTAVGSAAADAAASGATAPVAATGDVHPLSAGSLGVLLWLSVGLLAVIVAFVVLRRSRAHLVETEALSSGPTTADRRAPSATAGR